MRLSKSQQLRQVGRWEGQLHELRREIEEHRQLIGCPDLRSLVDLACQEASRTREAIKESASGDPEGDGQ